MITSLGWQYGQIQTSKNLGRKPQGRLEPSLLLVDHQLGDQAGAQCWKAKRQTAQGQPARMPGLLREDAIVQAACSLLCTIIAAGHSLWQKLRRLGQLCRAAVRDRAVSTTA